MSEQAAAVFLERGRVALVDGTEYDPPAGSGCVRLNGTIPAIGSTPRVGFKPTRPQYAAGMRAEPSVSVPSAAAQYPAASAAAEPPLDPPGLHPGARGFSVRP